MAASTGFTHKAAQVTPPLKGSFPLDRKGVCKALMSGWMACMMENKWNSSACRVQSAAYLKCRAEHNLMAPEEPALLGFTEAEWRAVTSDRVNSKSEA
ncbi:cytochrome c oxidase assembly protein subunit 19 [Paragonimus westermani]|uniref:Cytochrome c oxidase assembly protein COX19 n=1 Tax=Paragonimus westermani TaxID=34504 RepID=A0A5J4NBR8_9TREM|nr:cytochrome c oxidase assembly protein subunit 19 [Paragonimus westermani]